MLTTSTRLLRLLSLLQTRPDWTGAELAAELGVGVRTVRNDVERLRRLGYQIDATRGATGGYRLGIGAAMPPLLLDAEEAVALAVGLLPVAERQITGIDAAARRALAKLDRILPSGARHRVTTLQAAIDLLPGPEPTVDPATLLAIAAAVRDRQGLRFDYRAHDGTVSQRMTETHRLAHTNHRWYLVAWDVSRADWRTFRVDRLTPRMPTGPRFMPRDPPQGTVADYLAWSIGVAKMRFQARVRVFAPAADIAAYMPPEIQVSPLDERTCEIAAGADTPQMLTAYLGMLEADFAIIDAPELAEHLQATADRFHRAITPQTSEPHE